MNIDQQPLEAVEKLEDLSGLASRRCRTNFIRLEGGFRI